MNDESKESKGMLAMVVLWVAFILFLVWINWLPYTTPALAEEPCLRITTGTYTRNYAPNGTTLNRRPTVWGVCTPFAPYQEP